MDHLENQLDLLSRSDWANLEKLQSFLLFFHDATVFTESRGATIDRILPTMDSLLEQFEEGKERFADDLYLGPCCNSWWQKLEKYYNLTDRSPVYIAALQYKWEYMETNWIIPAKLKVQELWQTEYQSTAVTIPTPTSTSIVPPTNSFI